MKKQQLQKIEKKIERLIKETRIKLISLENGYGAELINFAQKYNEIWNER